MAPKTAPRPRPEPDALPGDDAEIARVEQESWFEHPEGSAPPLDRVTQDRKPPSNVE